MLCKLKKKKIYPAFFSKHNLKCEKQVVFFLMISQEEV